MRRYREDENRYDNEIKNLICWRKKIPHENLAKWSLKRVQESENQEIRNDNKRTRKLNQARSLEV